MKRRSFLQSSSFLSLPLFVNGLPISSLGSQSFFNTFDDDGDNILVLIQLNGGNDGLNTIIPLQHYDLLANVRSNVIIPDNELLKVSDDFAFHPEMGGMMTLYDEAKMTIVHDAGYPDQNRSHFRSTDIWTTGSPADEFWTTGWIGRYLQNRYADYPEGYPSEQFPDPFALTIGSNVSETCQGTITNFSLALADPLTIAPVASGGEDEVPDTPYGKELEFLRTTIAQANAYGSVISEAAEKGSNISNLYDDGDSLAQQLKAIALLISGGLKTRIYIANIGGFDTHANQVENGDPTVGEHGTLLRRLSNAVHAFQDDLSSLGLEEKVLTMTFSEFGRRIRSNDSLGTDHGTAAPLLVFGSCVNPGFIGESPALPDQPSQSDGVPMQFDFRSIYGSVLMDWFGVEKEEIQSLLFEEFSYIPIIKSCRTTTSTDDPVIVEGIESNNFPNPFDGWTTIRFRSRGERVHMTLFDATGHQLKVITDQFFNQGEHEIRLDGNQLMPGNYFYRIQTATAVKTKAIVRI